MNQTIGSEKLDKRVFAENSSESDSSFTLKSYRQNVLFDSENKPIKIMDDLSFSHTRSSN